MGTTPRISIVTPSLNMGAYIEDAIRSVKEQDYPNFEHIIIDACSTDGTLEILKRYPHLRWVSEKDRGQSDALNKGFGMADGDIVGWLNADEYYLPGALHTMAQAHRANPGADVLYGDGISVDEVGRVLRSKPAHRFDYGIMLYYGCFIATVNTFFKRSIFDQGLFLDAEYRVVMDFEYFVRLAAMGKSFSYVPSMVGAFRWTGTNASLQTEKRRRERLQVQRTWSRMKLPDLGYDAFSELYRAKRVSAKLFNGNYLREFRILKHAGAPSDWFRCEEARKSCATLVKDYFGSAASPQDLEDNAPSVPLS
jgi:glycosyltransferase involved in cell wall biosynthesis